MKTNPLFPSAPLLLCLFLLAVLPAHAQPVLPYIKPKRAQAVQLAWDPSPSPGVVATIIRRGNAAGQYLEQVRVDAPATSYTWTNLTAGTSYFVVTAITANDLESEYSNEVSGVIALPLAPNLRSAVPITVEIYRKEPGKLWAKVIELGPFYDMADTVGATYQPVAHIGQPVKILPE